MKLSDAIGAAILTLGIIMTALMFFAMTGAAVKWNIKSKAANKIIGSTNDRDSNAPHLTSVQEVRELLSQLEDHGAYKILSWRREVDNGGQIEIVVTYWKPK